MTAAEKMSAAHFLDTAGAFLKTGYRYEREPYNFTDDTDDEEISAAAAGDCEDEDGAAYAGDVAETGGAAYAGDVAETGYCADAGDAADDSDAADAGAGVLEAIAADIRACTGCGLCATRINAVPGEGAEKPLVLVVGEGPGADEDASGRPFVGPAGQLLDKMLLAIGLDRKKNCFIANVIKCRPPKNRDPYPDEAAACFPFFERQLAALNPPLILTVGKIPVKTLLGTDEGITRLRGNWKSYHGIPLLPTFHPSYLLRDESQKQFAWEDLKSLCRRLAGIDADYAAETAELRKARNI
ncbi:MAG: uracil-DNA glycosylase [Spirochaetaceae bacterium]|jgi:DNA polymerase|nr:uracil-DNA glycosylase [Spirochaetaceae bacterium]